MTGYEDFTKAIHNMSDTHSIDEKAFAEKAGLAPALVAEIRRKKMEGGVDYTTKKNRVTLTLSGCQKVLQEVGADSSTAEELAKKAGALEPRTLFVSKVCMNVRLLYATPERGRPEGVVTVRVRDNRQHPVGSEIRACAPAEGQSFWRGLPRKKARMLS